MLPLPQHAPRSLDLSEGLPCDQLNQSDTKHDEGETQSAYEWQLLQSTMRLEETVKISNPWEHNDGHHTNTSERGLQDADSADPWS